MRNTLQISVVLFCLMTAGLAQAAAAQSRATKFRLNPETESWMGSELYITVAGKEGKSNDAFERGW